MIPHQRTLVIVPQETPGGALFRATRPANRIERGNLEIVDAAGIDPFQTQNPNPMMAHDFGFYGMKTFELPRCFFSLESSPVLEIFWRRRNHVTTPGSV
jgi:hypothetical protein